MLPCPPAKLISSSRGARSIIPPRAAPAALPPPRPEWLKPGEKYPKPLKVIFFIIHPPFFFFFFPSTCFCCPPAPSRVGSRRRRSPPHPRGTGPAPPDGPAAAAVHRAPPAGRGETRSQPTRVRGGSPLPRPFHPSPPPLPPLFVPPSPAARLWASFPGTDLLPAPLFDVQFFSPNSSGRTASRGHGFGGRMRSPGGTLSPCKLAQYRCKTCHSSSSGTTQKMKDSLEAPKFRFGWFKHTAAQPGCFP